MTTLTWTGAAGNGNPNDAANWQPHGVPGVTTNVVFPYGTIQLAADTPWTANTVTIQGGAQVTFTTSPSLYGALTVTGGATLFVTAPTALNVLSLVVNNGASVISAPMVEALELSLSGGARMDAQNGLWTNFAPQVDNGSTLDVTGAFWIGSKHVLTEGEAEDWSDIQPGSSVNWHGYQPCCYAKGTMIALADGTEKAIEDIEAGDLLLQALNDPYLSQPVVWIGRGTAPTSRVMIQTGTLGATRPLIVTSDHLIFHNGFLYPAHKLTHLDGVSLLPAAEDFEYYHLQALAHSPLIANGVMTETFLDTDGRADLETVSGTRLDRRFTHEDAFAGVVR